MIAAAWYDNKKNPKTKTGSGFGIRITKEYRDKYFKKEWHFVILKLDGFEESVKTNINKLSFWGKCPELIKKEIGKWFFKNNKYSWPKGKLPKIELINLNSNIFKAKFIT